MSLKFIVSEITTSPGVQVCLVQDLEEKKTKLKPINKGIAFPVDIPADKRQAFELWLNECLFEVLSLNSSATKK